MKVLIIASSSDVHATSVCWGLQQLDTQACLWPTIGGKNQLTWKLESPNWFPDKLDITQLAIWNRRPQPPLLHPQTSKNDEKFIYNEQVYFLKSFLISATASCAFAINDCIAEERIDKKPLQLMTARETGFNVPETILTNDPVAARAFATAARGKIICKPLLPHFWEDTEKSKISAARAFILDPELLKDNFNIEACPVLLQAYCDPRQARIQCSDLGRELLYAI